tara:strand:+ start:146 stop:481 length:336 start_codon:yes stop_codon:yes gene_type:complete
MKPYKDFLIKTFIVTVAAIIILQFLLSPLKKSLRMGEIMLNKIEIYEKQIKNEEFFIIYHQKILNNLKKYVHYLAETDEINSQEKLKTQNSIKKIIDRDIKPILDNIERSK